MENYSADRLLYQRAKKKVCEIRSFYINLFCYCIVIPFLIYINLTYSPEYQWFWFSAFGWGIGLTFHAIGAFNNNAILGENWERRKIQELMEKERLSETAKSNQ